MVGKDMDNVNEGRKKPRLGNDKPILDVWRREVGVLSSRNFAQRVAASEDFVLRLDISRKLEKHRGCVNTVSFNESGNILVSGSDDRRVILWDWETGRDKLMFHSGHSGNVFQAKVMPNSSDCSIVTCAADGHVRHAVLHNCGRPETLFLGSHDGRAHNLSIEPGSPHIFYTCGEDGGVQHFDLRTKAATVLFTCCSRRGRRSYRPINSLNAIAIDPRNSNLFTVGGNDEYARIYDIRKYRGGWTNDFDQPVNYFCPQHIIGDDRVGITGLAFSDRSELLVSYNDENIYLFGKDMGLGPNPEPSSTVSTCSDSGEPVPDGSNVTSETVMDIDDKSTPLVYKGHRNCETVKGVSFFGPKCEYVVSGSDCGRIFIWRKKDGEVIRVMEADKYVVNCIKPHPHTTMLASSGIEKDIKIWTPKAEKRATLPDIEEVFASRPIHLFHFDDDSDEEFSIGDDDHYSDDEDGEDNSSRDSGDDIYDICDDDEDEDADIYLDDSKDEDEDDSKSENDDGGGGDGDECFVDADDNGGH